MASSTEARTGSAEPVGAPTLLIANRAEIAVRIAATAADLGMPTVAVHPADDVGCLHVRRCDRSVELPGSGARAYLDPDSLIRAAHETGSTMLHPGYGFLAESDSLALACETGGVTFVGPSSDILALFGDKPRALELARRQGVSTLDPGLGEFGDAAGLADAIIGRQAGVGGSGPLLIKARAGGGGRGLALVDSAMAADEIRRAAARCAAEAEAAFGDGTLYVERYLGSARHVEVQILGDRHGNVVALGERECSLQRRRQKLVEIGPVPGIHPRLRERIVEDALTLARACRFDNLGTFEFLVDVSETGGRLEEGCPHHFIEANARIQVEHTVTEETTGLDLVALQIAVAQGATLAELGLAPASPVPSRGFAIEARVNTEILSPDGQVVPTAGTITHLDLPGGPGVRIDTHAYAGYGIHPGFDSLLAKIVVRGSDVDYPGAVRRLRRALAAFGMDGVDTNIGLLSALAELPEIEAGVFTTTFVTDRLADLATGPVEIDTGGSHATGSGPALAGANLAGDDPLAVLEYGRSPSPVNNESEALTGGGEASDAAGTVPAPLQGTIVAVLVEMGEEVPPGREIVVMEAMKMQHAVRAPEGGIVTAIAVEPGQAVMAGHPLLTMTPAEVEPDLEEGPNEFDPDEIRPDLAEVVERHRIGLDEARPEAVERRHRRGHRTARENLADICDPDTFVEYAPLVVAAQRKRRSLEELITRTPADGMIAGIGDVNGDVFDADRARSVIVLYDYTVLAGTQGHENHRKKDRIFALAADRGLPVVLFAEGGGGRPGDTDGVGIAGLDGPAFHLFARLSGRVPLVGITTGFCFAGNAALLGCCDVIIATEDANIGMGGPAMIEGGGLGVFRPEEVGPMSDQVPNGVVDVTVADEAEAVAVARRYLSYFQGPLSDWEAPDQRLLRRVVPQDRLRAYDIHSVIEGLADVGSILELRPSFGPGMVTALIRIEGRPLGVIANNPLHLAGAIDSDGADKASRFMALCDAFDLPILSLCDTPGIMVGPEAERSALVRHASRMFVTGASISVPFMTIVTRKGYGLGAMAMAGGGFRVPLFTVAWPTGEFGGMGLEGAVKLGYRRDLEAVEDPAARRALYEEMVQRMYDHGKALSAATHFEIDDVIDPADSRRWILSALTPPLRGQSPPGERRPFVDTW